MNDMANVIKGIIDRTEGEFAVIKIAGDQELYWPKNNISFNYASGDKVNVSLNREEAVFIEGEDDNAKNILRKIFQPNV